MIFVSIAPNAYRPEKPMHTPRYSFGVKLNHEKTSDTPGKFICIWKKLYFLQINIYECHLLAPGHYNNEKVQLDHTPSYSFGVKINHEKVSSTPGIVT